MPKRYEFGELDDGSKIDAIEIGSDDAARARLLTYGANLAALWVPTRGEFRNVVLGHPTLAPYLRQGPANGAIVGRYSNRIAGGSFLLDGGRVSVDVNLPPNTIHGGSIGFAKRVWHAELDREAVVMKLHSTDGDQGFPGNVDVEVRYEVTDRGLSITYRAVTDAPTIINLTNHAYFNLSGNDTIRDHSIYIAADHVLEAGADGIPTGAQKSVAGTPFDFRRSKLLASVIDLPDPALRQVGGYDHHYVFSRSGTDTADIVATASAGGLKLQLVTTEPGMQFYTANFLKPPNVPFSGFCFETQHAPDSPNHASFPTTVVRPGTPYYSRTEYTFSPDH